MQKTLSFTVNGEARTVTTDPGRPLLDVLREDLGLTGAKYGCGEGRCRACTVLVDGKCVSSCNKAVESVAGQNILTIEGLARGDRLHPVQEAFLAEGAFQCGYCTSGMILRVVSLLDDNPHPARDDVLAWMDRHLCRCCGYPRIERAIRKLTAEGRR